MHPQRVDGVRNLRAPSGSTLVAIGNFDGVHRGHQAVIRAAVDEAAGRKLVPVVLTFNPHPAEVLGRAKIPRLTELERKVELVARVDPSLRVVVEPFTLELSRYSPRQFAEELLARGLGAAIVIVGDNFRFGNKRAGDLGMLVELGRTLGFEARALPLEGDASGTFSSTRARELLEAGDLHALERLLGRPHAISGTVVHGDARGRTIGIRTANVAEIPEALPPFGVYACAVDRLDESGHAHALARGVANLGVRPTVSGTVPSFEVHLLDFDQDLYGARLRVHLIERLRGERKFASLEELVAQIHEDIARARAVLAPRAPDPRALGGWY